MQRTQQQWQALVQQQRDSDGSVKEFCLAHGIWGQDFTSFQAAFI